MVFRRVSARYALTCQLLLGVKLALRNVMKNPTALLLLISLAFSWLDNAVLAEEQPNIVFILADDLGYGDLGCYGHPVAKTPNIDRLAREGVRFTQHYSNGPECSPTRTALLTGRYQQRTLGLECAIGTGNVGRYDHAIQRAKDRDLGLTPRLAVLPSALKEAGYTCAIFGKWHLGYEPKFNPMEYGWDEFFGYLGGNVHYFNHRETSDLHVLFRGRLPVHRNGYMTHLITKDSIDFVKRSAKAKRPFFLYVSHECPHFPFQGPGDADKLVTAENWMDLDAKAYVAMLEDLDKQVGRITSEIDAAGIAENTVLVFASDNGGFGGAAHMGPLNGGKGTTLEGGIRVPLIIRCPGRLPEGVESDQVCVTFDLTRSFLKLANATVEPSLLDGYDIISHAADRRPDVRRTLFWRGRRGNRTWRAVRDADFKFVSKTENGKLEEWLYNLESDVGERQNLLRTDMKTARRLRTLMANWEKQMTSAQKRL